MPKPRKALTLYDDYYAMMSDPARMRAYERAIAQVVQPGDVVIDLGSGLGILGFMALRAGAARVHAIEQGDAIELARKLAAVNGLSDRMHFVAANSKDCVLDEQADVIISETLGSFAVDENTLDFTIDARDRLLRPGGRLVPERLRLQVAPVTAPEESRKIEFWKRVNGFDYSPARDECVSRMGVTTLEPRQLLAPPQVYADIDLYTVDAATLAAKHLFQLTKGGAVHGFAGWFEAQLCEGATIDTSPNAPATHWGQAFFPLRDAVQVIRGDYLEVTLRVEPKSGRSDNTSITYDYRCTQLAKHQTQVQIGRNSPCPCGSGRKYKRCCGAGGAPSKT